MVGAGRNGDGGIDATNLLKPYLESDEVRFIGATTYDEYNRNLSRSKGLLRRFQQIDVPEPSVEESIRILEGLKKKYEQYHGIRYDKEAIAFAVKAVPGS